MSSSDTEILPDRFDREGRLISGRSLSRRDRDRQRGYSGGGGGGQQEMVERLVSGFGDVVEGRASWRDLLRGVLAGEGVDDAPSSRSRRRR